MKKQKTTTAACGGGGEDFLIEILLRLPVVSLLRFKSVCKSWLDLIHTSFFIHLHTTFISSSSNFGTFIVQASPYRNRSGIPQSGDAILMLSEYEHEGSEYDKVDDQEVFKVDDQLMLKVDNLEFPSCYKLRSKDVIIKSSCNGLICLYDQELKDVSLWNPATRQSRILPKSLLTIETDDVQHQFDFVAFGFDVKTKDYKVLLITQFSSKNRAPKFFCRVQVYSLSTDSWRLFEGDIDFSLPRLPGLYLNGSWFFESRTKNGICINAFDFTKEIFTTMQLPPDHGPRHDLFLRCLGGEKMTLFTTLRKRPSDEYDSDSDGVGDEDCDIYEHSSGVNKESWTKLHSFQIKNTRRVTPRGISNNGKFALLQATEDTCHYNRMQLYNLVTKRAEMDIPLCENVSNVYVYKPSLVSIIGGNGVAAAPCDRVVIGGALVST